MIPANSPVKSKTQENKLLDREIEKIVNKLAGITEYIQTQSELSSKIVEMLERLPNEVDLPMSVVSSLESTFRDVKKVEKSSIIARDNVHKVKQMIMNSSSELVETIKKDEPSPLDPVDSETINSLILVNHHKLKELGKIVEPLVQSDQNIQKKHDLLHERFNTIQSVLKDVQQKLVIFEDKNNIDDSLEALFQKQKEELTEIMTKANETLESSKFQTGPQTHEYDTDVAQIEQIIRFLQNFPRDKHEIIDKLKELRDSLTTGDHVGLHHRATSSTLFREILADYKSVEGHVSQKTNQEVIDKLLSFVSKIKES
jgi:hypothetical protein